MSDFSQEYHFYIESLQTFVLFGLISITLVVVLLV